MSTKKNKVKFNICNVHYALITVDDDGDVTFGDAGGDARSGIAVPGAQRRSRPTFTRMGMPTIRSPTTWAMRGIWNWPWYRRVSGRMC